MSCLTAGRTRSTSCARSAGGYSPHIYIANAADVDSLTVGTAGEITAITMVATKVFFKVEFKNKQNVNFTEAGAAENGVVYTQSLTGIFQGDTHADRELVDDLHKCQCGFYIIVVSKSGELKLLGLNDGERMELTASDFQGGTALADAKECTITFSAEASQPAPQLDILESTIPV